MCANRRAESRPGGVPVRWVDVDDALVCRAWRFIGIASAAGWPGTASGHPHGRAEQFALDGVGIVPSHQHGEPPASTGRVLSCLRSQMSAWLAQAPEETTTPGSMTRGTGDIGPCGRKRSRSATKAVPSPALAVGDVVEVACPHDVGACDERCNMGTDYVGRACRPAQASSAPGPAAVGSHLGERPKRQASSAQLEPLCRHAWVRIQTRSPPAHAGGEPPPPP